MPSLTIAKARALEELLEAHVLERLAALESRLAADRTQPPRRASSGTGGPLRVEIARILAAHAGQKAPSAKAVRATLKAAAGAGAELPSERTIRWHLAALKRQSRQ